MTAAVLVLAALVEGASATPERVWVGADLGLQGVSAVGTIGDAEQILTQMGVPRSDSTVGLFAPRAHVGLDLDTRAGVGLELEASWFAKAVQTQSSLLDYQVRRDVFPIGALVRFTGGRPEGSRFLLSIGPTFAPTRLEEHGWLGEGTRWGVGFGALFVLGARVPMSETVDLVLRFNTAVHKLPRLGTLIVDGDVGYAVGFSLGADFAL